MAITIYLILAAVIAGLVLMMMAFTYPELLKRFGIFIARAVRHAFAHPASKR